MSPRTCTVDFGLAFNVLATRSTNFSALIDGQPATVALDMQLKAPWSLAARFDIPRVPLAWLGRVPQAARYITNPSGVVRASGELAGTWKPLRLRGQGHVGGRSLEANGVAIDSRSVKPGELFVALKDARDGHDFVVDARANGAAAAMISRSVDEGPALIVDDTLDGLRKLALASRKRSAAIRVAVTGSVGKTSVKEALAAVFRRAGKAHASEKSYNNHWGVPLTLARMPRGRPALVVLALLESYGYLAHVLVEGRNREQRDMLAAARWVAEILAGHARRG